MKARETRKIKKENFHDEGKKYGGERHDESELLRYLRLRHLFLRMQEERVQLPGEQLQVRLPETCALEPGAVSPVALEAGETAPFRYRIQENFLKEKAI